jgi:LacI family transcriptional regulator
MTVKLEDIARNTGFSVPTVSRVLTNSDYPVNEKTREKILKAAQEMGYRPNIIARSLRTDRTKTVGIVIDDLLSPFTPPIVRGIQDCLTEMEYVSLIINTDLNPDLEKSAVETLSSRPVDGIIFVEFTHKVKVTESLQWTKPTVFVHRLFGHRVPNSIVPDDYFNASLVIEHLYQLGHRKIGYVNGPETWHSAQHRFKAYCDGLEAHSIALNPAWIQPGDWEQSSGYAAASRFLALNEKPTAIFAANDLMALGAIYAIQDAGLRVPEDIAVAGYDNRDFTSICRPQLTTVSLPVYEMGYTAGEMILRQIVNGTDEEEEVKVKGELFIRKSCGASPELQTPQLARSRVMSTRIMLNAQPEE